jgi:hypothetical protein
MSEAVVPQIKAGAMEWKSPVKFIVAGLIFLVLVVLLESWKPGIITGPVKSFVGMFGVKTS